ncbi:MULTISPECIES: very short patch repair endonuclease [unclassified Novosphingobium]|uniref:very short patch repair endonuclease n=1 Tax=unclassified Novosphingobium TaxID=2644732 RepID=UPI0025CDFE15|nr:MULTISPECIES: very short patch repair endonuclease [unclassified Novosphingobium]HQV03737.1 very short patch repair endonuclease [Novosphingobium sp.]
MADTVSPEVRSRMMAGIRGKDTQPELTVRRALHAQGFRYRLHAAGIPGRPDLVLPKYHAVIFVHGCFWHGHECHLFRWPRSREEFWRDKIGRNRRNDTANAGRLDESGWRQAVVWECALKGRMKMPVEEVTDQLADWLRSGQSRIEIAGRSN